ncbi:hypothetical protein PGT21_002313 [Puccinia graminis f. sp. tritici]|uniref:Uncharacterized protein n=1 Tax=Puccinia graminis f. sp. tritici TaxID=56615 RepID=A0A5B0QZH4_PUCGR|nr:hypothetical protein PGT21_002313 [Puccinia graminis f. sp. tritici]
MFQPRLESRRTLEIVCRPSQAAELTFKTRSTNAISNLARASAIAAGSGCASGSGIPAAVHRSASSSSVRPSKI